MVIWGGAKDIDRSPTGEEVVFLAQLSSAVHAFQGALGPSRLLKPYSHGYLLR